ncbi:MAG TPA: FAD-binding oxidoreductase [Candidatus Acidoferrales bacterium]|nr:FAD-binding oxidoreductase [Candidatus Acidoferrales bacterium]
MENEKDNLQTCMPTRPFIPPRDFRAVLRRVVALTPSTKHFEWEAIEGGAFEFYAGQFVSLEVPRNGEPEARPYSIASAPRGDSRFDLCLNRVEGGYVSNYLCDLEANAIVNMKGPHGSFVVSQPVEQDLVFIATGTGIAPIRGMLAEIFASRKQLSRDVWLLFGVRHPDTILYREEFEAWAAAHQRFHFVPTLSRPPADWRGETGYVQDHLRKLFAGRSDFKAYICGLKAMVDEVRFILKEDFGLDRKQIRFEKYD